MIPPDVASRLQTSADVALRPVAPTQELTDKLSGLVAGQKVMAEIQAMLPNGTYRAVINQRNITLALPFSAKSGDTLELQVTESDGKIALAVVSHKEGGDGKTAREAVSATLSRTGQFIGQLFSRPEESKEGAKGTDPQREPANCRCAPEDRSRHIAVAQTGNNPERHVLRIASSRMGGRALPEKRPAPGTARKALLTGGLRSTIDAISIPGQHPIERRIKACHHLTAPITACRFPENRGRRRAGIE